MSTTSDATLNHGIVAYYKHNPVFLKYLNTDIKQFVVTDMIIHEFKQVTFLSIYLVICFFFLFESS